MREINKKDKNIIINLLLYLQHGFYGSKLLIKGDNYTLTNQGVKIIKAIEKVAKKQLLK